MRILYDHQIFSLQRAGGISGYFQRLVGGILARKEDEVRVELGLWPGGWRFDAAGLRQAPEDGRNFRAFRFLANEATSSMARAAGTWDVVHPTYYRTPKVGLGRAALVVTHHDCTVERYPGQFRHAERIRRHKTRQFARARVILCVSQASREDLHHFYDVDPAKTLVVHHGVDHIPLAAEPPVPGPGRPRVLFVGSRANYKNFPFVVKALASDPRLSGFDLHVAGGGPWTPEEGSLLAESGMAERVHLDPQPSDEAMAAAFQQARVLAYPSSYEGFGFPPLEALRAGTPAVVARQSSLPEVCGRAGIYFEADDFEGFREALHAACFDDTLRATALAEAPAALEPLTWDRCVERTLAAYRQATGASPAASRSTEVPT